MTTQSFLIRENHLSEYASSPEEGIKIRKNANLQTGGYNTQSGNISYTVLLKGEPFTMRGRIGGGLEIFFFSGDTMITNINRNGTQSLMKIYEAPFVYNYDQTTTHINIQCNGSGNILLEAYPTDSGMMWFETLAAFDTTYMNNSNNSYTVTEIPDRAVIVYDDTKSPATVFFNHAVVETSQQDKNSITAFKSS